MKRWNLILTIWYLIGINLTLTVQLKWLNAGSRRLQLFFLEAISFVTTSFKAQEHMISKCLPLSMQCRLGNREGNRLLCIMFTHFSNLISKKKPYLLIIANLCYVNGLV